MLRSDLDLIQYQRLRDNLSDQNLLLLLFGFVWLQQILRADLFVVILFLFLFYYIGLLAVLVMRHVGIGREFQCHDRGAI